MAEVTRDHDKGFLVCHVRSQGCCVSLKLGGGYLADHERQQEQVLPALEYLPDVGDVHLQRVLILLVLLVNLLEKVTV